MKRTSLLLAAAIIFLIISPLLTPLDGMNESGWTAIAVLVIAVILWLSNIIPAPVTSMLLIAASALFGILSFEEAAIGLGKDVIWLIIAMLIIGVALENTGLDKRIAFQLLDLAGGIFRRMVLMLILFAFILTFFVPNAVGRVAILLPICMGMIKVLSLEKTDNSAKIIILTNTFIPIVTSSGLITASSGTIYAAGLFSDILGYQWDYSFWLIVMMPGILTVCSIFWLLVFRIFPIEKSVIPGGISFVQSELQQLGKMSVHEIKLIMIYVLIIICWITRKYTGLSLSLTALLAAIIIFLPKIGLLEWKAAKEKIDWGIPLIFAAGFTIASMLEKSGVVKAIGNLAETSIGEVSPWIFAFCLIVILVVLRLAFNNDTPMIASLLPVILTFAQATPFNPLWVGMIAVASSSFGYLIPSQSTASMAVYSTGYLSGKEFFQIGLILSILMILLTLLISHFYWPLIGLHIYP